MVSMHCYIDFDTLERIDFENTLVSIACWDFERADGYLARPAITSGTVGSARAP
jgi:hypothetical protein